VLVGVGGGGVRALRSFLYQLYLGRWVNKTRMGIKALCSLTGALKILELVSRPQTHG
jgi:hypothetical protein